eukprot:TRINITY_DN6700_c0_g1_i2.p1 TRINITY_DN6700_c0_g1~~TRINITY_DN6700_c0_g1_i2.p1  ORF type:complete len:125 (+),score=26.11 TRINITY_DN6700_c0_g1_i2:51-425(+)
MIGVGGFTSNSRVRDNRAASVVEAKVVKKHKREVVQPDDVARVRSELEARLASMNVDEKADSDDPDFPPIVVKENVTFDDFIRWSDYEDDKRIGESAIHVLGWRYNWQTFRLHFASSCTWRHSK